ncbi:formylglycine-generating enzyme family protein [Thioflexithrix psekupsensis]|uniref:Sulfatase-modifying factor enzyme-like domain-containing protein n=1 Tax=Thioflexithrix psekupsensis TaxID=1570016 RepID=A0A251X689_9GAMM|nr:formylglycine-generating enzyme family protein [Thioflexithrix psekupsensis]OUD12608.1 hypothetical protein TPSD3_16130 [Thioflexithrix psekupsensis]
MSSITQAKAEAQKLIKRYNKLQAEAKTADAAEAARKAAEAEKLVSQISALQSAITKLQAKDRQQTTPVPNRAASPDLSAVKKPLSPPVTGNTDDLSPEDLRRASEEKAMLESRIARIESAQQRTRAQIEQLSRAKQELARLKQEAEQSAAKERRANDEKLQQELAKLIEKKEAEQEQLRKEMEAVRKQAEKDAELLKLQRDSARAIMEKQKQIEREKLLSQSRAKGKKIAVILAVVVLLVGGGVSAVMFTPILQILLPSDKPAPSTQNTNESTESVPQQAADPTPPPPAPVRALGEFQDRLRSGGTGPTMVRLPAGTFMMGIRAGLPYPTEQPQHQVSLNQFAISKYEVTFADYDRFARATGRELPDDRSWGRSNRPVINVTWDDATEYAKWLSEESGKQYRLPTEREWEYAAKAGTDSLYWWGSEIGQNNANCAICGSQWAGRSTAPVGSFQPNAFGLHDVIGNVQEWTLDCFRPNYTGAPPFGAWEGGDCSKRMVRSSSYRSFQGKNRTTQREDFPPKRKSDTIGFRVVRVE